jgi:uncharacterized repeat protein (TIGR02543 family)
MKKKSLSVWALLALGALTLAGCGGAEESSSASSGGATPTSSDSSSAGASEAETYRIDIATPEHGSITADKATAKKGETVTLTVTPDEHYEFLSLTVNSETITALTDGKYSFTVEGDTSVSGLFQGIELTITFDSQGGSEVSPKTVRYDAVYGDLPTVETPPSGMDFDGWYTEAAAGIEVTSDMVVTATEDFTLYAHYAASVYTITLNPDGGTLDTTTVSVTYGSAVGALPTPTRDGYVFAGWYDADGVKYDESTVYSVAGDITLTAKWGTYDVSGLLDKLVTYPGDSEAASMTLAFSSDDLDTSLFSLSTASADIAIDGLTVTSGSAADHATAEFSILYDGVEVATKSVFVTNYKDLGYVAVSTAAELDALTGSEKAVLIADIDYGGAEFANDSRILTGVLDGDGHSISNGKLKSGWNGSLFTRMQGTAVIRDIAFIGIEGPDSSPFGAGLISLFEGGTIKGVFLSFHFNASGDSTNVWTKGGTLFGDFTSNGGVARIEDSLIYVTGSGYENVGCLAGGNTSLSNEASNTAVISADGYPLFSGVGDGMDPVENATVDGLHLYGSAYEFLNTCEFKDEISQYLSYPEGGTIYWNSTEVVPATPEWEVLFPSDSMSMHLNDSPSYLSFSVKHNGSVTADYEAAFASSDTSIATIDEEGLVTPVAMGTATITVTISGNEFSIPLTVTNALKHITTYEELKAVGDDPTADYVLDNDIDCGGAGFYDPDSSYDSYITTYSGVFDGQGHKISNLYIAGGWNKGFIHTLSGTLKNTAFVGIHSGVNMWCGGFIGTLNAGGLLDNVFLDIEMVETTDSADEKYEGALIGGAYDATATNCLVNITEADGVGDLTTTGSLIGRAGAYALDMQHCYAIKNGITMAGLYVVEAASGCGDRLVNCGQYDTYADFKSGADTSTFDATLWTFNDSTVLFGGAQII